MIKYIPSDYTYCLDRANYEYVMAISQMSFILTHHAEDDDASFLRSDIFKRLHQKIIVASAQKWCAEAAVLKEVLGEVPKSYHIDLTNSTVQVR